MIDTQVVRTDIDMKRINRSIDCSRHAQLSARGRGQTLSTLTPTFLAHVFIQSIPDSSPRHRSHNTPRKLIHPT